MNQFKFQMNFNMTSPVHPWCFLKNYLNILFVSHQVFLMLKNTLAMARF